MSFRSLAWLLLLGAGAAAAQDMPARLFHASLSWAPDSRELVFVGMHHPDRSADTYASDLYVLRVRNGKVRRITDTDVEASSPSWTRDGRIVFAGESRATRTFRIYVMPEEGGEPAAITPPGGDDMGPAVSPDGRRIAFVSRRDGGKYQLHVMNFDGSGARRLVDDAAREHLVPQWSPDGRTLVYQASQGDGLDQIWSVPVDGGAPTLLTGNVGHNINPSWSIDGTRILFATSAGGAGSSPFDDSTLATMNADGSQQRSLGNRAFLGRYSPDGLQLAYVGGPFGDNQLFVANSDGTDQKAVTE